MSLFTGINKANLSTPFNDLIIYQLSSIQLANSIVLSPVEYLINNILCVIYNILLGFSFSILSLFNILYYATNIGSQLNGNFSLINIFETIALIFTFCGSLLVTKFEIRIISTLISGNRKNLNKKLRVPVKDIILSLTIIIILLILSTIIYVLL